MKVTLTRLVVVAAIFSCTAAPSLVAATEDGIALAIVYDTSGSMKERVRDSSGQMTPKHVIAKKALLDAVRQIQNFATNAATGSPRKIDAALFIFKGGSATEAIPFGPFNAKAITDWVNGFSSFDTGTPLGNALAQAGDRVLKSNRAHRHVLVITDGMNTLGPDPAVTLPKLKDKAGRQEASLAVHFVAFDVDARVFNPIKKLGATVVSAADEKQLKSQLEFILQRKILLEDEEPAKKN